MFLNVYKVLEEMRLLPTEVDDDDDMDDLRTESSMMDVNVGSGRYLSMLRELWGEVVEMEGIL
jgi:hypothetical protein